MTSDVITSRGAPAGSVVIGMPVYNGERRLPCAIESLLAQTDGDFRLVIRDNASTDRSLEVCREYAKRDARVLVESNPVNVGIARNFNAVFDPASRYFMWASCNDYFAPQMLERCRAALDSQPDAVIACGQTRLFTEEVSDARDYPDDMNVQEENPHRRFVRILSSLRINNVMHGLIRTSALRRTALIGDYVSSDMVLVAELALLGKFVQFDLPTFHRRMAEDSATEHMTAEQLARHYRPRGRGVLNWVHWKIHAGYLRAVLRSPLPFENKLRVLGHVLKGFYWDRRQLKDEVAASLRHSVGLKRAH